MTVEGRDELLADPGPPETVAVIGLGLMGGSLARDLAAAGSRVLAFDARSEVEESARETIAASLLGPALEGLEMADVVVIATPVDAVSGLLERLAPLLSSESTVTDVGSTKASICRHAVEAGLGDRFVGSHPLVGDHRSGWTASRNGLFRSGRVFVCPTASTGPKHLQKVLRLWASVGARCEILNPAEHDRRMAWTSHLPQVVSSALAVTLREHGLTLADLGPGGRDMLRLAGSAPEIWTAISLDNAENLAEAIEELIGELRQLQQALRGREEAPVSRFFTRSRDWHRGAQD